MGGKTAIALGLLLGVVAGTGLLVAALLLAPEPTTPGPTRPPLATLPPPTASPIGSIAPSQPIGGSPSASPSAGATPDAAASPGASSAATPPGSPAATGDSIQTSTSERLFGVGGSAPVLSVPGLDGGTVDLASFRGRPVWVNFMASYCPPCRDELPLMAGFQARYESNGLAVLLIDEREDAATVRAFLAGLDVSLPAGLDGDGSALADWGGLALPVHFWVGADGTIRDAALGGIGPDVMARALSRILPGVNVTP